jgi:MoxR-like ATPase
MKIWPQSKDRGPGHVQWAVLATYSDEDAMNYFRTVKGQDEKYAQSSLNFLRKKYGRPAERDTPAPATPTPEAQPAPAPMPTPAKQEPAPTQEDAQHMPTPTTQTADGMAALAGLLAPHMLPAISGTIQTAINAAVEVVAQAAKAPVIHVTLPGRQEARELEGLHHCMTKKVLQLVSAGENVMLVGPAGCGKSTIAKSVAQAMQRPLTTVSFSGGLSEAQLWGRLLPLGDNGKFKYVEAAWPRAYQMPSVTLLDELDAGDPNTVLSANAALANGGFEIEARAANDLPTRIERHPDAIVIGAANTWGSGADTVYCGRNALDGATTDRFYFLEVDYDQKLEAMLAPAEIVAVVHLIRAKARTAKLRRVVSTRMILRLSRAVHAGISLQEAIDDQLKSWTRDERSKVGY